jgi:hypothetical protein
MSDDVRAGQVWRRSKDGKEFFVVGVFELVGDVGGVKSGTMMVGFRVHMSSKKFWVSTLESFSAVMTERVK